MQVIIQMLAYHAMIIELFMIQMEMELVDVIARHIFLKKIHQTYSVPNASILAKNALLILIIVHNVFKIQPIIEVL
jgi:hypothetical protein